MGIIVILIGIILMVIGVKTGNRALRNIGIAAAVLGCVLTANSGFVSGVKSGINDTLGK